MYWIGKGVLKTQKEYTKKDFIHTGEEIPAGALDKSRINELEKKGLVSDKSAEARKAEALKKVDENLKKAERKADK